MSLTPQIKSTLDDIIVNEEGGWRLTANANDPDGGWTFAGITKNTWGNSTLSYSEMAHHIAENFQDIQEQVYEIYDKQFIAPLQASCVSTVHSCFISAAINIGTQTTINLIKDHSLYRDPVGFIAVWQDHYIQIVKANAEAWRQHAQDVRNNPHCVEPKVLRAETLLGWINRTRRYYTMEIK